MTPLLVLLALPALLQPAHADTSAVDPTCSAAAHFPSTEWTNRSGQIERENPEPVAALDAWLFPPALDWNQKERQGRRTDGIVIIHKGEIVYERYDHGYTQETPHIAWSATKSFVNALAGIATREGLLGVEDSICKHLPKTPASSCAVKLRHALEFSTGWDWRETYEGQSPTSSSVLAMLYGQGHHDMAAFVAAHPTREPPGESWAYSSGDTNVASAVVGKVLGPAHGPEYPWKVLFEPLGMRSAVWERDGAGTYIGSSYLFATPRDLARFGWLLANDGCWEGERLLPEGWVAWSASVSDAFKKKPIDHDGGPVQGRALWINAKVPEIGQHQLPWPSVPEGSFAALGHWRQSVYVIPQADLVVVRTGDDRDGTYRHDETLRLALELVGFPTPPRTEPSPPFQGPQSDATSSRKYDNSLLRLASSFSAQEVCSCLFVMKRDEAFCREWTRVSPEVAKFRVDWDQKRVRARALGMGRSSARYLGERWGCAIEED